MIKDYKFFSKIFEIVLLSFGCETRVQGMRAQNPIQIPNSSFKS